MCVELRQFVIYTFSSLFRFVRAVSPLDFKMASLQQAAHQIRLLPKPLDQSTTPTSSSGGKVAKEVKKRDSWKNGAEERLLQWLETPGYYDKYRSASQVKDDGRTRTSGKTKEAIKKEIVAMLAQHGFSKTTDQVHNKIDNLVGSWKKAHRSLGGTGFGAKDDKNLNETVRQLCPHWDRLSPILRDRPGMSAPFTGDNEDKLIADVFSNVRMEGETTSEEASAQPSPKSSGNSPPHSPAGTGLQTLAMEDHRSRQEKILDGDYIPSDDEEQFGTSSTKSLTSVINNSAKKATAGQQTKSGGGQQDSAKKPREKPMDLVGVLLATGKERNDRAAARNEMVERRYKRELDLKEEEIKLQAKKQHDDHEVKMKELEQKEKDTELRKAEIEIRKMELQWEREKLKK